MNDLKPFAPQSQRLHDLSGPVIKNPAINAINDILVSFIRPNQLYFFLSFQSLLSAAIACIAQYHKDLSLSSMSDLDFDRALLFYIVFVTGLVIVFVLFVSFLCDLNSNKKCGSPRGWTAFVSTV